MKTIDMPVVFYPEEYQVLKDYFVTDIAVRCFLHRKIEEMVSREVSEIERLLGYLTDDERIQRGLPVYNEEDETA